MANLTPNPPPNARMYALGNGTTAELLSQQTQIFWDPSNNAVRMIYNGNLYIPVDSGYIQVGTNYYITQVDLTNSMTTLIAANTAGDLKDPVSGADLKQISYAGVMALMKFAYDAEVNTQEQAKLDAAS